MTAVGQRAVFLRELTSRHDDLVVWKHLDRALLGRGDIDAAAPIEATDAIVEDAISIAAATLGATHVIRCMHVADKQLHFFLQPELLPHLFEFDICNQPGRGLAPWASPRTLAALGVVGDNGIRRLRPGAEAVVSLVYHGLSPSGRDRLDGDERQIVQDGLDHDLVGAREACRSMPPRPARRPMVKLVEELAQDRWDRRQAQLAFGGFVLSGLVSPNFTSRRILYRARLATGGECLMSDLARHNGRKIPDAGVSEFFRTARATGHEVIAL